MFDRIIYISDHTATVKLKKEQEVVINLMNLHVIFIPMKCATLSRILKIKIK